jgi:hypothetical protein
VNDARRLALTAVASFPLALGACINGSDRPSHAEFTERAETLCEEADRDRDKLVTSFEELIPARQRAAEAHAAARRGRQLVDGLRALGQPSPRVELFDRWLTLTSAEFPDYYDRLGRAWQTGDEKTIDTLLERGSTKAAERARLATRAGLPSCSQIDR